MSTMALSEPPPYTTGSNFKALAGKKKTNSNSTGLESLYISVQFLPVPKDIDFIHILFYLIVLFYGISYMEGKSLGEGKECLFSHMHRWPGDK